MSRDVTRQGNGQRNALAVAVSQCDRAYRRAVALRNGNARLGDSASLARYRAARADYLAACRLVRALRTTGNARLQPGKLLTGRIHAPTAPATPAAPTAPMRTRIIRSNTVTAKQARQAAELAALQARLTGWTRDLWRRVRVYAAIHETTRENVAIGITDGQGSDLPRENRVYHAPREYLETLVTGSIGMAINPDRLADRIGSPATIRTNNGLARVVNPRATTGQYPVRVMPGNPVTGARRLTRAEKRAKRAKHADSPVASTPKPVQVYGTLTLK